MALRAGISEGRWTPPAASGPSGAEEVGCATGSSSARSGSRLLTRRMAHMPQAHKAILTAPVTAEVMHALVERPPLQVGNVAAGAADNWTYLSATLPFGHAGLDFSHAAEHLGNVLAAAYGADTARDRERRETWSATFRDEPKGVDNVIDALCRLRTRYPRRKGVQQAVMYFRAHRHRMSSAALRAQLLPIGSGVVKAAYKTLVSQRLQRSGMRWREPGGQAILTCRALCQSERFARAWPLLTDTYKRSVRVPNQVIDFNGRR